MSSVERAAECVFERTTAGQRAQYLFYAGPMVWVEGHTDIDFFREAVGNDEFRIKAAGGVAECERLAEDILQTNAPYVVVMDGDYKMLLRRRNRHRRVITLRRYSVENYFLDDVVWCRCLSRLGHNDQDVPLCTEAYGQFVSELERELFPLIVLDVAHWLARTGARVVPANIGAVMDGKSGLCINASRVASLIQRAEDGVDGASRSCAIELVSAFRRDAPLRYAWRKEFSYSALRWMATEWCHTVGGRKTECGPEELRRLLVTEAWRQSAIPGLRKLRHTLRRAIKDAAALRSLVS